MDYGIRSGKILSLGIPKAPQGNIQGQPRALAWGCPGKHPLFRPRLPVTLLETIFLFLAFCSCLVINYLASVLVVFFVFN